LFPAEPPPPAPATTKMLTEEAEAGLGTLNNPAVIAPIIIRLHPR
jgi:hypothetical protein